MTAALLAVTFVVCATGNNGRRYLRVADVAERYDEAPYTVYRKAAAGLYPHRKRPGSKALLFIPEELDALDDVRHARGAPATETTIWAVARSVWRLTRTERSG